VLASLPVVATARRPATCAPTEAAAGEIRCEPPAVWSTMKLDPQPPLAATGDRTSGQAARLRDRVLPLHLTRPSAPSALATRLAVISMDAAHGTTTTHLQLVGNSHDRCARTEQHELAVFGRETRIEQRVRELAATTSCHAVARPL
jgi:hypothetical protein